MTSNQERAKRPGRAAFGFALIALVCAGFAAFLMSRLLEARGFQQEKRVKVVVASRPIPAAEKLTEDALRVVEYPESSVPPGSFGEVAALLKDGQMPTAGTGILPGEPIVLGRLADPKHGTAMAALVTPGMRAVAVKVDNSIARAGLLYPGARVDVLGTVRDPTTHISSSRLVVNNVRVLSVESQTDIETYQKRTQDPNQPQSSTSAQSQHDAVVTIEVSPDQSELVILAEREGKVDLALRNATDAVPADTPGVTAAAFSAANKKLAETRDGEGADEERERAPRKARRGSGKRIDVRSPEASAAAGDKPIETYNANSRDR
jgi:pilus assembly protein CpaB